ncbi:TIGR04222 domain-containing membrane protein [Lysobacter sp. CA196]|uniref:TIGR04222 domain-containing membrane protein n=1 Tax=Lysobacter sp. CA196 TaxID=3455606 RepID=UPI003F8D89DF
MRRSYPKAGVSRPTGRSSPTSRNGLFRRTRACRSLCPKPGRRVPTACATADVQAVQWMDYRGMVMNDPNRAPADTAGWTEAQRALWQRLCDYRFDDDDSNEFLTRVATTSLLALSEARAALDEYRRFCFLAVTVAHAVTPSQLVDEIWHTHIIDTRRYERFRTEVLRYELHHVPSRGGSGEELKHQRQYADTVDSYRRFFGLPPSRFWPEPRAPRAPAAASIAFAEPRAPWRPMRFGMVAVVGTYALMALGANETNPLHWSGGLFLAWFVVLMIAALIAGSWLRQRMRGPQGAGSSHDADRWELAYLSGGSDRVADAIVVDLLALDAVSLDYDRKKAREAYENDRVWLRPRLPPEQIETLSPVLREALEVVAEKQTLSRILLALRERHRSQERRLHRKGWLMTPQQQAWAARLSALPLAAVAALGLCKIMIGLQLQRPVGFLIALTVLAVFIALFRALSTQHRPRTWAGDWELYKAARQQRAGADDPASTVALVGTAVLIGTPFSDYQQIRTPSSSDSSGGDGGGGGGDGGGGCGGGCGGCGGCGGS